MARTISPKALLALRRKNLRETLALIEQTGREGDSAAVELFTTQKYELIAEVARLVAATVPPSLHVAVDPAMVISGYAFRRADQSAITFGTVTGIENLKVVRIMGDVDPRARVFLTIEYPTWKGHGTEAVRAAANCWIRAMKNAFPRRVTVRKVTPQQWMKVQIPGYVKARRRDKTFHPCEMYEPRAAAILGDPTPINENAAAAVCILDFAGRN